MDSQISHQNDFPGQWVASHAVLRSFVFGTVIDAHDAEDVLQEVARTAYASFDRYDPTRPFTPWVLAIARRRVADYFAQHTHLPLVIDSETLEALSQAHERLNDTSAERRQALMRCMAVIHGRGRLAIELRYRDELTVTEIARQLNTTPHAVSNLLNRVRTALADCIRRRLAGGTA